MCLLLVLTCLISSKDGRVRQHDLRTPHTCHRGGADCPPPLVDMGLELSTLALSSLTPYQFVVAGESPYVSDFTFYLLDKPGHVQRPRRDIYLIDAISDEISSLNMG